MSGKALSSTATLLGIDRKTLYNWRQIPAFQKALRTLSEEVCEAAAMRMRNILLRGTYKLTKMMDTPNTFDELIRLVSNKRIWDFAHVLPKVEEPDEPAEVAEVGESKTPPATPQEPAEAAHAEQSELSGTAETESTPETSEQTHSAKSQTVGEHAQECASRTDDACVDRLNTSAPPAPRGRGKPSPHGDPIAQNDGFNPSPAVRSPSPAP